MIKRTIDLEERQDHLNKNLGNTDTGYKLSRRYIDLGRQMGKTTQLIDSLPVDGRCFIVVHSVAMISSITDAIKKRRPELNLINIDFIVVKSVDDIAERLRPRHYIHEVFIDNAVWDIDQLERMKKVHMKLDSRKGVHEMKLVDKAVKAGSDTNFQPEMHVTVAIPMQLAGTSVVDQENAEKMLAQQFIDILKQK